MLWITKSSLKKMLIVLECICVILKKEEYIQLMTNKIYLKYMTMVTQIVNYIMM